MQQYIEFNWIETNRMPDDFKWNSFIIYYSPGSTVFVVNPLYQHMQCCAVRNAIFAEAIRTDQMRKKKTNETFSKKCWNFICYHHFARFHFTFVNVYYELLLRLLCQLNVKRQPFRSLTQSMCWCVLCHLPCYIQLIWLDKVCYQLSMPHSVYIWSMFYLFSQHSIWHCVLCRMNWLNCVWQFLFDSHFSSFHQISKSLNDFHNILF